MATGLWALVVDLRTIGERTEAGLVRSDSGAMIYAGTLKKALLQSVPYLPVALLPLLLALRRADRWRHHLLLLSAPTPFLAAYGWFTWHGGFSFNLRYWLPVLLFSSILAAVGIAELRPLSGVSERGWAGLWAAGAGTAAAIFLVGLEIVEPAAAGLELLILTLPLALSAAGLVTVALTAVRPERQAWPRLAAVAAAAGLAWAACVGFLYDHPAERRIRQFNLNTGTATARIVEHDSLVLVGNPDPFFALVETPGVRIAVPHVDDFRDLPTLLEHQAQAGKPTYGALSPALWRDLENRGILDGWSRETLGSSPRLEIARIVPAVPGSG